MPGAIDQAYPVWRIFMQHGHARIVEALWNNDACGQQRMSLRNKAFETPTSFMLSSTGGGKQAEVRE